MAQEQSPELGESTESALPNSILPESLTPSPTSSPSESTAEATEASFETTEMSPESTEISAEVTEALSAPNISPSPTASADRTMRSRVTYQLGENHAGILILADDGAGWQSSATSDEQGFYTLELRSDRAFRLDFSAALHLPQVTWIVPGDSAPPIRLAGGDLNADHCIDSLDLDLLVSQFDQANMPSSDINFDGMTDIIDLVILTGNMNLGCEQMQATVAAPENTAEASETVTAENSIFPTATGIPAKP